MAVTGPTAQNFPDAFVGKVTLSAYEPFPIVSSTVYSSDAPASIQFIPWVQPGPVGLKNLVFQVSMNAVVPTATNAASTGSEGYSYGFTANIFSRQDYGANSTNLVTYATGSGGLTATLNYAGTGVGGASQTFGMSWATDGSGGTSAFTTTSGAGNWSSFATGPKFLSIPFNQTYLSAGEYWLAVQHSSTTATSNSNVTLLSFSKLLQQWPVVSMGSFGGSATLAFSGVDGIGIGVASAITTNTTMPASVISASTQPLVYFAISNV
jgi:hypothetical protein